MEMISMILTVISIIITTISLIYVKKVHNIFKNIQVDNRGNQVFIRNNKSKGGINVDQNQSRE